MFRRVTSHNCPPLRPSRRHSRCLVHKSRSQCWAGDSDAVFSYDRTTVWMFLNPRPELLWFLSWFFFVGNIFRRFISVCLAVSIHGFWCSQILRRVQPSMTTRHWSFWQVHRLLPMDIRSRKRWNYWSPQELTCTANVDRCILVALFHWDLPQGHKMNMAWQLESICSHCFRYPVVLWRTYLPRTVPQNWISSLGVLVGPLDLCLFFDLFSGDVAETYGSGWCVSMGRRRKCCRHHALRATPCLRTDHRQDWSHGIVQRLGIHNSSCTMWEDRLEVGEFLSDFLGFSNAAHPSIQHWSTWNPPKCCNQEVHATSSPSCGSQAMLPAHSWDCLPRPSSLVA